MHNPKLPNIQTVLLPTVLLSTSEPLNLPNLQTPDPQTSKHQEPPT